ncbi:MAG: energy transducer TonB [Verrucomicrobiota bacterium]
MNTNVMEPVHWAPRRWWAAVLLVFAVQIGFIFFASERLRAPVPREQAKSRIALAGEMGAAGADGLSAWSDPTLFALVRPRGFSGPVWLNRPPIAYEPPHWTEPPKLLSAASMPTSLDRLVAETSMQSASLFESLPSNLETPRVKNDRRRLESAIRSRNLPAFAVQPTVPVWPGSEILTNSVVRVMVNAAGYVFSTVLVTSSGSREADQKALEIARQARFEPAEPSGSAPVAGSPEQFQFGHLVFEWLTVEPGLTNAPSAPNS